MSSITGVLSWAGKKNSHTLRRGIWGDCEQTFQTFFRKAWPGTWLLFGYYLFTAAN